MNPGSMPDPAGAERDFTGETMAWIAGADVTERKRLGQYMTPRRIRERLVDRVDLFPGMRVLDPGAGTGEFLATVRDREPRAELFGWDTDPGVLEVAKLNVPEANLERRSALDPHRSGPFDLVIGNPPYFQFRATADQKRRFAGVISGRPNIFALFFQVALESVRPGGQVAFVVPPSMNNGAYFEALRNFILERSRIEDLEILTGSGHFDGANTAAQLIVLRAGPSSGAFSFRRECTTSGFARTIFSPDPRSLEREFNGRRTLWELGFEAVTGTVVWNQHRDRLRDGPGPDRVRLIWAHNVQETGLDLDHNRGRPRYLGGATALTGPAIVVNRVVGAVGRGSLRAGLVPDGMEFVAENHVNVIRRRKGAGPAAGWPDLLAALRAPATGERVRRLTGNTQVAATELTHLLPLDPPD